jgi:hypothetical protein
VHWTNALGDYALGCDFIEEVTNVVWVVSVVFVWKENDRLFPNLTQGAVSLLIFALFFTFEHPFNVQLILDATVEGDVFGGTGRVCPT